MGTGQKAGNLELPAESRDMGGIHLKHWKGALRNASWAPGLLTQVLQAELLFSSTSTWSKALLQPQNSFPFLPTAGATSLRPAATPDKLSFPCPRHANGPVIKMLARARGIFDTTRWRRRLHVHLVQQIRGGWAGGTRHFSAWSHLLCDTAGDQTQTVQEFHLWAWGRTKCSSSAPALLQLQSWRCCGGTESSAATKWQKL